MGMGNLRIAARIFPRICLSWLFRTHQQTRQRATPTGKHTPASNLFLRPLLFRLSPARDPYRDHQNHEDDNTKLSEL